MARAGAGTRRHAGGSCPRRASGAQASRSPRPGTASGTWTRAVPAAERRASIPRHLAGMQDAEGPRRPGQRDVEIVRAAQRLGEDPIRIRDEHRVELQPLGLADPEHDDRRGQPGTVAGFGVRHGRSHRVAQLGEPPRRHQHGELAGRQPVQLGQDRAGEHRAELAVGHPQPPGFDTERTHRPRRLLRRAQRREHVGGHRHDLRGSAVVHRQRLLAGPRAGRVGSEDAFPRRRAGRVAGLGDVPDDRHRPGRAAAHHHPPRHLRQLLRLVDDDVSERPHPVRQRPLGDRAKVGVLVPVGEPAGVDQVGRHHDLGVVLDVAGDDVEHALGVGHPSQPVAQRRGAGRPVVLPEQLRRLVEQRDVRGGPTACRPQPRVRAGFAAAVRRLVRRLVRRPVRGAGIVGLTPAARGVGVGAGVGVR